MKKLLPPKSPIFTPPPDTPSLSQGHESGLDGGDSHDPSISDGPSFYTDDVSARSTPAIAETPLQLSQLPGDRVCFLCHLPLEDPTSTPCEHVFCAKCLEKHVEQHGKCPICFFPCSSAQTYRRSSLAESFTMNDRQMYCSHYEFGCRVLVAPSKLRDHLLSCLYVPEPCPNHEQCGKKEVITRNSLPLHLKECPYRMLSCPNDCGISYRAKDANKHTWECTLVPVDCPNRTHGCQRAMLRVHLEAHVRDCPFSVKKCPMHQLGCNFTGGKDEMYAHLQQCPFYVMRHYIARVRSYVTSLQTELSAVLEENDSLAKRVASLEHQVEALSVPGDLPSQGEHHPWDVYVKAAHSLGVEPLPEVSAALTAHSTSIRSDVARAKDIIPLGAVLRTATHITTLKLRECTLGSDGAAAIASILSSHASLTHLDLTAALLYDVGVSLIAAALPHNATLSTLILDSNGLTVTACHSLSAALANNSGLTSLDCSSSFKAVHPSLGAWNFLQASGLEALSDSIKFNKTLQHLSLAHTRLGLNDGVSSTHGIRLLVRSLAAAPSALKSLNLSYASLHADCGYYLSELLKRVAATKLMALDVAGNALDSEGIAQIAEVLSENITLSYLDLSHNKMAISTKNKTYCLVGCQAVVAMFRENRTLGPLNLNGNGLRGDALKVLEEAIQGRRLIPLAPEEEEGGDDDDAQLVRRVVSEKEGEKKKQAPPEKDKAAAEKSVSAQHTFMTQPSITVTID
jgi:hypothetical protein